MISLLFNCIRTISLDFRLFPNPYLCSVLDKIFLNEPDSLINNLSNLAFAANLDYIFVTFLDNISDDPKRVMLKGEVLRYQSGSNKIYRYEMLSYAEDINLHIQAIKKEMIDTIPHSVHSIGKNRNYILAGIAIILAIALSQSLQADSL